MSLSVGQSTPHMIKTFCIFTFPLKVTSTQCIICSTEAVYGEIDGGCKSASDSVFGHLSPVDAIIGPKMTFLV